MINRQYEDYLQYILSNGVYKSDRTGTGTYSVFGYQMRFDLREGFPLITTKKVHTKSIIHELLWFLKGESNIKYLKDNGVSIWDEWADENGDLGPVYGKQWRSWPGELVTCRSYSPQPANSEFAVSDFDGAYTTYRLGIDQIQQAVDLLKNNPDSRRIIVTAWNPAEIPDMKLPPCHAFFQFYTEEMTLRQRWDHYRANVDPWKRVRMFWPESQSHSDTVLEYLNGINWPKRYLSCQLYQRSCDSGLGVPFNIASYALLTEMFAQQVNMVAKDFVWTGGDCHIYSNHIDQVKLQLEREVRAFPKLKLNKAVDIFSYKFEDVAIEGYDPHPHIPMPVAV